MPSCRALLGAGVRNTLRVADGKDLRFQCPGVGHEARAADEVALALSKAGRGLEG